MSTRTLVAAALAVAGLAGCQTWGPSWSEISGSRYNVTDFNRSAAAISLVDGVTPGPRISSGYRGGSFYKIEPGKHTIEMQALNRTPGWVPGLNRQDTVMDIAPCKRYYLNAQFENRLLAQWKPVVDYIEPIPGCRSAMG